jgi:hypothetical protein
MSAEATKITDRRAMTVLAEQPASLPTITPMEMLAIAVKQGADLEKMRMLMDLKREWEADEARRKFNEAFAAFKAEAIVIVKSTLIKDGPLKGKKHANLFDVVGAVTPKLSAHGLSIAWKLTKDDKDWMEVTCTLRHAAGHSESVSMGGGPDTGPGRNAIQARGSTKSYLERYTATAILGLAASDDDDDGNSAGKDSKPEVIAPTGYDKWRADMKALADEGTERLQDAWKKSNEDFRRHAVDHDESWWKETKRNAAKVKS